MGILDGLLANALVRRLGQQAQATGAGRLGASTDPNAPGTLQLPDAPVLGGLLRGAALLPQSAGLIGEGAGNVAKGIAGELALAAAAAQAGGADHQLPGFDPGSSATAVARAMVQQGAAHPGRVLDVARNGPDSGTAWLAGALELASNPLNYAGGIGEAGRGLEAGAPLLGKALQGAALAGEITNRAPLAPLAVIPAARRALLSAPAFLRAAEGAAPQAAPAVDTLVHAVADQQAAREQLAANAAETARRQAQGEAARALPLAPGSGDYNRFARAAGLPPVAPVPPEPSPLVPQGYSPFLAARQLAAQQAEREAAAQAATQAAQRAGITARTPVPLPPRVGVLGDWVGRATDNTLRDTPLGSGPAQLPQPNVLAALAEAQLAHLPPKAVAIPKPVQPVSALVQAAQQGAKPNALEGLLGAARQTAARDVTPKPSLAQIEAAVPQAAEQLPLPEASAPLTPDVPDVAPGPADRVGTIQALANGPVDRVTALLRDLHQAIYPNGSARYAVRALTGINPADFHVDQLLSHPSGNAVEPYLDYLLNRVQADPQAAARLADINPGLAEDVARLAPSDLSPADHKLTVQALFDAPSKALDTPAALPDGNPAVPAPPDLATATDPLGAMRDLIVGGDGGKMGGYAPNNADFYAKRLGIPATDVPALLDQLVQEGTLGRLPDGSLGIKPAPQGQIRANVDNSPAPLAKNDIIARGKQAISDLFDEAADDKLTPVAPARLWPALGGQLGGAALGGLAGATQGDTPEERLGNAAKGALTGVVVGGSAGMAAPEIATAVQHVAPQIARAGQDIAREVASRVPNSGLDPSFWAEAAKQGFADQLASQGAKGVRPSQAWGAFWRQWRAQVVNTVKQLPQDALTQLVTRLGIARDEFGVTGRDYQRWVGILRQERSTGTSAVANPLTARLRALGQTGKGSLLGDLENVYGVDYGTSVTRQAREGAQFGATGRAIAGGLIGAFDGLRTANPVQLVAGAARGVADPGISGGIRYMNAIQHDAARFSMAEKALDRDIPALADNFLTDLANKGINVAPLQAKGGYFSPAEVEAIAGKAAADDWQRATETLIRAQGDRIAFLNGDFRDKLNPAYTGKVTKGDKALGTFERTVGKHLPFSGWTIHYAPVLAELAARHPLLAATLARQIAAGSQDAQAQGLKPYQANTIPISTETPVAGALARAMLGGQQGTWRVDPLGALVPFGAELGGEPPSGYEQTAYQQAKGLLGRVGFSPAPPIQALAYVLGQDYQGPGALSRTSGLERAASLIPGMPELPGGGALLDDARSVLEPALNQAGIPTAGKTQEYDPTARRYAELVADKTGKTLDDRSNRQYLATMGSTQNPLWQQAQREVLLGGAVRNLASVTSPVSSTAQGADARAVQQAKGGAPFTADRIAAMQGSSPLLAAMMQQTNARYTQDHPEVNTYAIGSVSAAEATLLKDWEQRNDLLKKYSPTIFRQREAAYLASIRAQK